MTVKDHLDNERRNLLLLLHGLLSPISSNGSFICTIPQTGQHIPWPLLYQSWLHPKFQLRKYLHQKYTNAYHVVISGVTLKFNLLGEGGGVDMELPHLISIKMLYDTILGSVILKRRNSSRGPP